MKTLTPFRRKAAAVAAGAALVGSAMFVAQPAAALDTQDFDNLAVTPAASSYADGASVTVSGSGFSGNTAYVLGVCEYETYASPFGVNIPACGTTAVSVTTNSAGSFTATVTLDYGEANAHAAIPGQPANLDLSSNLGEVLLVEDHGTGFRGTHVGDSAEFTVNP